MCLLNTIKLKKLLGLVITIVLLHIIVFSPGLLGLTIGSDNAIEAAAGITLLVISFIVLLYGSYKILFKPTVVVPVRDMKSHEDYVEALNYYNNVKVLEKDVHLALDQLDRIEKKKITLLDVLGQRFDPTELSYKKFNSVIHEVEKLLYMNIRGVLNKLSVFDASEYSALINQNKSTKISNKLIEERTALYNEYLNYVTGYLESNEEILLKLDKLLLEISLLGSIDYRDIEEMPCIKDIDALIKMTKFYKQ